MLKRILVAAAVTGLIAGAALPVHVTPALAGKSGCKEAAKAQGHGDRKARHAWKKECKARRESPKKAGGEKG
jgi:hypothetical protein